MEDSALLGPIAVRNGLDHARESVQKLVETTRDVGGAMTFLFHPDRLLGRSGSRCTSGRFGTSPRAGRG